MSSRVEWPWRVGTRYNIHVYAVNPDGNRDHDIPVGTFSAPELAVEAVYAHNRLLRIASGHSEAEWAALGDAVAGATAQWEHSRDCIDDDCTGCPDDETVLEDKGP